MSSYFPLSGDSLNEIFLSSSHIYIKEKEKSLQRDIKIVVERSWKGLKIWLFVYSLNFPDIDEISQIFSVNK